MCAPTAHSLHWFHPRSLPPKSAFPVLSDLDAAADAPTNVYQPTAPRKLSEIRRHTLYHEHCRRLDAFDTINDTALDAAAGPAAKAIRRRELTRFTADAALLA